MCVGGGDGGGAEGVGRGGWVCVGEGESEWYRHVFVIIKMIYRNDPYLIIVYLYWLTRIFTDSMCPEDTFEPHQEKTHLPTCVLNASLRKHAYSNTLNISQPKTESFQTKILIFLYFCSKHRLWVPVGIASPRRFLRVPTIYVLSRNKTK